MKKELVFLQVSSPTFKETFLQHIHNLIQIPIETTDTYNTLFEKLRKAFEKSEDLPFIEDWIQYNLAQEIDPALFNTTLTTDINQVAVFDLVPIG